MFTFFGKKGAKFIVATEDFYKAKEWSMQLTLKGWSDELSKNITLFWV